MDDVVEHRTIGALVVNAGGEVRLTRADLERDTRISVTEDPATGQLIFKAEVQEEPNKVVVEPGEVNMRMSDSAGEIVEQAKQETPAEESTES